MPFFASIAGLSNLTQFKAAARAYLQKNDTS